MVDELALAASRRWFPSTRYQPDATLQLFCLPFAGGGASAYRTWSALLGPQIEVWPVEYPGHETRFHEPAIDNARDLSRAVAEQIALAADRPFALFGHSMGALLAFESSRILAQSYGRQPLMLFVSGLGAPHLEPFRPPIFDLPEVAFRDELRTYGGTPEQVLLDEDFMRVLSPLVRRDLKISETYIFVDAEPLNVPIVAFGGNDDPTVPWGRMLQWAELTRASFRAEFMPGKHFFIKEAAALVCGEIAKSLNGGADDVGLTPPGVGEVHLWTVPVRATAGETLELQRFLSDDERDAAGAFMRPSDKARYVTTRAALRTLSARYSGLPPDVIKFAHDPSGKPRCDALRPLDFNVSHSGAIALIAFSSGCSVGVDVERIRADFDFAGVGRDVFTETELEQLARARPDRRTAAFFDLWVRKEAYFKRSGEGIGGPIRSTHLGLSAYFTAGTHAADCAAPSGSLLSFSLAPEYAAAIAVEQPVDRTIVRPWNLGQAAQRC